MADTNILLQRAYEVRDEVSQGGNTASRIGTLFADIIENFELYAKKSDVISMIPEVDLSGYLSKKDAANTYLSKIDAAQLYTSLAAFSDLFSKVVIKEAVAEETDVDGNVITPAQPAVYGIRANYDFFSTKNISAFGFSNSEGSGSGGSVDVTQILSSGVHIATINGVEIYAPEGGGASSWAELTGNPPSVSFFENDAGYITAAGQLWQENGGTYQITGVNTLRFDDADVYMTGVVDIDGSFEVVGDSWFTGDVNVTDSLYIGDATNKSAKYVWLGYRGLFIEGEGSTSGNPWYGTLCTQDAYTQKSINMRYFNPYTAIQQLAVGSGYLDGTTVPSYTLSVIGQSYVNGSSIVDGTLQTTYLAVGGASRPNSFWFASPNGYFGNPSTGRYTQFSEGGDIELSHPTPFIDFHYGCSTADFTSRLIAAEDGVLMIQSATTDPALRIGNAYLRYDLANNALYVTGAGGAQVNFYATGNVAGFSGLDGSVSELANLDIAGQLTAASVKANYLESDGDLRLNAGLDSSIILNKNTTFDSDGWITTPQLNATQRIVVNSGGDIRIGSAAADHRITDVYADGSYVYITINGKRYRFTPSSTTAV